MSSSNPNKEIIPNSTLFRLPTYLVLINQALEDECTHLSSSDIADRCGITSNVVRKDLGYIGSTGKPRTGFNLKKLREKIESTLGYNDTRYLILVGKESFSNSLLDVSALKGAGIHLIAIFIEDPTQEVIKRITNTIGNVPIYSLEDLREFASENTIDIAALDVNKEYAQEYADQLVGAGIRAIWNFTIVDLEVGNHAIVQSAMLEETFAMLWYRLKTAKNMDDKHIQ